MNTRSMFLSAALAAATVASAQAKVHNDNGALAAAGLLGGALGYLGGSNATQGFGSGYGQQGYYPQQQQPYYERPAYYAPPPTYYAPPPPPVYYAPPPPVYYAPPGYVLVPPPGYYGPRY